LAFLSQKELSGAIYVEFRWVSPPARGIRLARVRSRHLSRSGFFSERDLFVESGMIFFLLLLLLLMKILLLVIFFSLTILCVCVCFFCIFGFSEGSFSLFCFLLLLLGCVSVDLKRGATPRGHAGSNFLSISKDSRDSHQMRCLLILPRWLKM